MAVRTFVVMRRARLLVTVMLLGLLMPLPPAAPTPDTSTRPFVLPIPAGDRWFVCQGYNGEMTHRGTPALDLSLARSSPGPKGCMMPTKYTSAGSEAVSPAAGVAYRASGCCGNDFVCVDLDSGGSVAVGHLDHRVPDGTRVGTAQPLGTVAWPGPANGDYAHIHVQVHPVPGCMDRSEAVPFDQAHGFKFACSPDLSNSGETNQYSGLTLTRCPKQELVETNDDDRRRDGRRPTAERRWSILMMRSLMMVLDRWAEALG